MYIYNVHVHVHRYIHVCANQLYMYMYVYMHRSFHALNLVWHQRTVQFIQDTLFMHLHHLTHSSYMYNHRATIITFIEKETTCISIKMLTS